MSGSGFLGTPDPTPEAERLFEEDISDLGFVMNTSKLWAYQADTTADLFALIRKTVSGQGLSVRHRSVLVVACAAAMEDSYCSLVWGGRLADATDPETAGGVLRGDDSGLTPAEQALAAWARKVVGDPSRTTRHDVQELRDAGWTDAQIFAITTFVALRMAFSTVNDALGALPDSAYRSLTPRPVLDAVTYGRPIADGDQPAEPVA